MAHVFISYKREERSVVERLAQELRELGLDVWFDASLNAGDAFSDEIDREAHAANAILVCWSPTARQSKWVKAEALIGFEHGKLAACYIAGPDGFYPPAPFNSVHAEDLRAWAAEPSNTHPGYKSILRRIGALCGRADIESFGSLDTKTSATTLRAWLDRHPSSPLFGAVNDLLHLRNIDEAERIRSEQEALQQKEREVQRRATQATRHKTTLLELERPSSPTSQMADATKFPPRNARARDMLAFLVVAILTLAFGPITLLLMRKWISLSIWGVSAVAILVNSKPDWSVLLSTGLAAAFAANVISLCFLILATAFSPKR